MSVAGRFGKNVAAARRRGGHSQEAVALRASLHRTEIGLLERGERMPRLDTAIRLAGALGVSLAELADGIAWEPGKAKPGRFEVPNLTQEARQEELAGRVDSDG